jgi:phage-related protein
MAETLPSIPIAFSPQLSEEPRVRRVKFGDGYEARLGDGLNTRSMNVSISWKNRTHAEMAVLMDFFRRHNGQSWFWWAASGEEGVNKKFVCPKWSYSRSADSPANSPRFDINCEFYQVFDLG